MATIKVSDTFVKIAEKVQKKFGFDNTEEACDKMLGTYVSRVNALTKYAAKKGPKAPKAKAKKAAKKGRPSVAKASKKAAAPAAPAPQ